MVTWILLKQWFPEVRHFCRDIPVILIGCKTDLRKDKECIRKLRAMNQAPVTYTQVWQGLVILWPHVTKHTHTATREIVGVWFAGWGDPAADESGALPRVFGKISGERGGTFQRGNQKNVGLHPQTKELQEEEEMCHSVKITGSSRTGGDLTSTVQRRSVSWADAETPPPERG